MSEFIFNPAVAVVFVIKSNLEILSPPNVLYSNILLLVSLNLSFEVLLKVKYLFKL